MKKFFTTVLVMNLIIEGFAAISLISAPQALFPEGQLEGAAWARNYGFAALAMGSAIFWVWPNRDNIKAVGSVLGMLLTFHIGISISLSMAGNQMPFAIVHGIMAVLTIFLFTQRSKWCSE